MVSRFISFINGTFSYPDDQLTETAESRLKPLEKLHDDLFVNTNHDQPANLSSIAVALDIFNVQFDQMSNIMKTRGKLYYEWSDAKYVWDPENYDNIRQYELHYHEQQTWLPILKFPE